MTTEKTPESLHKQILNQEACLEQGVLECIGSPIFYKDCQGIYRGCNKAFEEYLGKSKEEIIGKSVYEISPRDLADIYHQMDQELLLQGGKQVYESSVLYADGTRHDVVFTKTVYYDKIGEKAGLVGVITDISEYKQSEQIGRNERRQMAVALATSEEKFYKAFHCCADVIGILRLSDECYIEINDRFVEVFGYSRKEVIEKTSNDFSLWQDKTARDEAFATIRATGGFRDKEVAWCTKEQEIRIILLSAELIEIDSEQCVLFVVHDITERKRAENALLEAHNNLELEVQKRTQELESLNKTLWMLSSCDGLTGIANRRRMDMFLEEEWLQSRRRGSSLALIMLDLDFFKKYNDAYGHQAGDECLKRIATLLQSTLKRESDLAARFGGEEFVAILPDTDIKGGAYVAEILRQNIEKLEIPHKDSLISTVVTASLGVAAIVPQHGALSAELLLAADQALYQAKKSGRNCVKVANYI